MGRTSGGHHARAPEGTSSLVNNQNMLVRTGARRSHPKARDSTHHSRLHLRRGVVGGVVVEHERREAFGAMWEMRLALLERQRTLIAHARGLPHVMLCAAFGVPPGHEKTTRRPPGFARVLP